MKTNLVFDERNDLRRRFRSNLARLFEVECCDGIEAHGTQRRDIAGGDGEGGYVGERGKIVGRDTVEQAGHVRLHPSLKHSVFPASRYSHLFP